MEKWEHEFATLGQELIAYLGQNKAKGPAITRDLKERFRQIKLGIGHKNIEGIHTPFVDGRNFQPQDGYYIMSNLGQSAAQGPSVTHLRTPEGNDLGVDTASFRAAVAADVAATLASMGITPNAPAPQVQQQAVPPRQPTQAEAFAGYEQFLRMQPADQQRHFAPIPQQYGYQPQYGYQAPPPVVQHQAPQQLSYGGQTREETFGEALGTWKSRTVEIFWQMIEVAGKAIMIGLVFVAGVWLLSKVAPGPMRMEAVGAR